MNGRGGFYKGRKEIHGGDGKEEKKENRELGREEMDVEHSQGVGRENIRDSNRHTVPT